jgi:hypothetical protein
MWLSSVNISLSLWKIVQCRKGALALFGSPLLEILWKDGPFFYFVSFLRQSSCLRKRSDVFCFYVRSRRPCFDDHSVHILIRHTGLGFINIALLLLESVRKKCLFLICKDAQIFLCIPSIPKYNGAEASTCFSLPSYPTNTVADRGN